MKPKLLDCTLRDGAYIVKSIFGDSVIHGIIYQLEKAGVEIIECGWLKDAPHAPDSSFFHIPADLEPYLSGKRNRVTYAVMIDWDRYDLSALPERDGRSVDAIRVVFPHEHYLEGVDVGRRIAQKGYQVYFQAANTMAYSEAELIALAEAVNASPAISLSVVDTFGAMYEEDLERVASTLHRHLRPEIALGFHSHNNQQLSFALSQHFIRMFRDTGRQTIVDASLCGMGRGAGNATTELTASYLNRKCGGHYDMDAIMDAIDIYMGGFQEKYTWGYSTPYFISGLYGCHVNNIAYLLNNHRVNARDMRLVIESMAPEDRRRYDYDLLERKYLALVSRDVDDAAAAQALKAAFQDRELLLIAPGKSVVTEREKIGRYIAERNPVVIGVNAMVSDYVYDYVLYVNPARYDYARTAMRERFEACKRIVLSNIKAEPGDNEWVIAYAHAIRRGWEHFDNAVICALRILDWLGIGVVTIAGFDGFKHVYSESYADPSLPTLKTDGKWDALNDEIRDMYQDFRDNAVACRSVTMLTESYFEQDRGGT
ncbi:MAG: hypothetical protein IJI26_09585 [Clostridia bacterium]|nr:hypothetical protein [Clostridia bacterium]